MVAIIRSLLSIALIVSAEATLTFKNTVNCSTGEVTGFTADATLDTCVAEVKKIITASTTAVSGCTITTTVTATADSTTCEEVGTVVAKEVTPSDKCKSVATYGTDTKTCTATTIADGLLTMKAPKDCTLTIKTTLSESGGNGGEGGAETALTFKNEVACKGGSVEVTDSAANLDEYVAKVKEAMATDTSITGCTITTTVSATASDTCQEVGTVVAKQVTTEQCTKTTYGSTKDTCESATIADGFLTMKPTADCVLTITTTLTGGEGNETEGGDNTGSSGVTPALTLGCLTAVVAALN